MDYRNQPLDFANGNQALALPKAFMSNVFSWMTLALALTGIVSFVFGSSEALLQAIYGNTILRWIVMLAPLGFVIYISARFEKMAYNTLLLSFFAFSILMGISMSYIFAIYDIGSIFKTFLITSLLFGSMAVLGYTTSTDLTKFGSILTMAVIGLVIASIVNMIWYSGVLDLIISGIGVLVFTGLTAYDTQKLKRIGMGVEYGSEISKKLVIMGALSLYLDFINLFLFLLRFMGGRGND